MSHDHLLLRHTPHVETERPAQTAYYSLAGPLFQVKRNQMVRHPATISHLPTACALQPFRPGVTLSAERLTADIVYENICIVAARLAHGSRYLPFLG